MATTDTYLYEVITKAIGDKRYLLKDSYTPYSLPIATASVLGGIKVGSGLSITSAGVLSANVQAWSSLTGKPFSSLSSTDFTVTNAVLSINSANWVKKTELQTYYTKDEINTLIANLKKATITIVESLPSTGEEGIIYFVGTKAPYEQYVWESGIGFIDIGSTEVDLSAYVTGSNLTADTIITGSGSKAVKSSGKKITTSLGTDDSTVPTSKAVKAVTDELSTRVSTNATNIAINKLSIATNASSINTLKSGKQDKITPLAPLGFGGTDNTNLYLDLSSQLFDLGTINNKLTSIVAFNDSSLVIDIENESQTSESTYVNKFMSKVIDFTTENKEVFPLFVRGDGTITINKNGTEYTTIPSLIWKANEVTTSGNRTITYVAEIHLTNVDILLKLTSAFTSTTSTDSDILNISIKVYQ